MIYNVLDTDFYKFTTSYAAMQLFPQAEAVFEFKDRNRKIRTPEFLAKLKELMREFCVNSHQFEHSLSADEINWLIKNIPFISEFYWEWLDRFHFSYGKMEPYLDEDSVLCIRVEDKWYKSSLYEIPCMFLTVEAENITNGTIEKVDESLVAERLRPKVEFANKNKIIFSEFGTRRRFSQKAQDNVVRFLKNNSKTCVGTSNVWLAMKYDMKPIGTHPHEFFQAHQIYGYRSMNYMALENWSKVYQGNLGTALTDTVGVKAFLQNFTMKQAKLFDGVRQDSGNEFEFADKFITKYKELGVDPMTKTIIFSNALDFEKAERIKDYCNGKIKCSFGIGTNLTNDWGYPAENIVMKMTKFRLNSNEEWMDVIKISDDSGKHMGNEKLINMAKYQLGII